ncbi:hypothetical protein B0O99DRAFT_694241 [Bisporella sp. PMI_857]|nr:hypothetical protein B0O99DRAFT_694241 [Bisporella sp. PMI_857]
MALYTFAHSETMPLDIVPKIFQNLGIVDGASPPPSINAEDKEDTRAGRTQQAKIIVGFPGIGKSTIVKDIATNPEKYKWLGIAQILDEPNYAKGREVEFLTALLNLVQEPGHVLLLPAHSWIGEFLVEQKLSFTSVFPTRDAKEEYRTRYVNRGSPMALIEKVYSLWDIFIDSMKFTQQYCNHVILEKEQYLADVFPIIMKRL